MMMERTTFDHLHPCLVVVTTANPSAVMNTRSTLKCPLLLAYFFLQRCSHNAHVYTSLFDDRKDQICELGGMTLRDHSQRVHTHPCINPAHAEQLML
jgi:hypothetical protein